VTERRALMRTSRLLINLVKVSITTVMKAKAYFKTLESRVTLTIAIPKDLSKPDGDAVENGLLLSAEELIARGHFVNSPSDTVPIVAKTKTKHDEDDDPEDKTYQPPKKSNDMDDEAPGVIYGSDGEEILSETEYGRDLVS